LEFIPFNGHNTLTFRQIDQQNNLPKGSTFRLFKRCQALREGQDFFYLAAGDAPETIARWREAGLIYPATVNVVLITESGYRKLQMGRD